MKTAERNNRIRWADMFSVCANGTAGRNRRCSSTWGWKQEKLQRWERYFLLTSPSIERLSDFHPRLLTEGLSGCRFRIVRFAKTSAETQNGAVLGRVGRSVRYSKKALEGVEGANPS